jgi:hypothetical protein
VGRAGKGAGEQLAQRRNDAEDSDLGVQENSSAGDNFWESTSENFRAVSHELTIHLAVERKIRRVRRAQRRLVFATT